MGGQPRDLLIESAGVSGTVAGPRDLANCRPMGRAIDPWGIGFEENLDGPQVQATPLPSTLPTVVPGGPRSTGATSTLGGPCGSDMRHDCQRVIVELNVLDVRSLDA